MERLCGVPYSGKRKEEKKEEEERERFLSSSTQRRYGKKRVRCFGESDSAKRKKGKAERDDGHGFSDDLKRKETKAVPGRAGAEELFCPPSRSRRRRKGNHEKGPVRPSGVNREEKGGRNHDAIACLAGPGKEEKKKESGLRPISHLRLGGVNTIYPSRKEKKNKQLTSIT